jgi:hypothetical protein
VGHEVARQRDGGSHRGGIDRRLNPIADVLRHVEESRDPDRRSAELGRPSTQAGQVLAPSLSALDFAAPLVEDDASVRVESEDEGWVGPRVEPSGTLEHGVTVGARDHV